MMMIFVATLAEMGWMVDAFSPEIIIFLYHINMDKYIKGTSGCLTIDRKGRGN
jgi:hypothetical protein